MIPAVPVSAIRQSPPRAPREEPAAGALLYQFVNLAVDLLYAALDPRVRLSA